MYSLDPLLAPAVANLRHSIRTGYADSFGRGVPTLLSGGRRVYRSSLMVHRDHLPDGMLHPMRVPLLVERRLEAPTAMTVPKAFWPDALLARWA